MAKLWPLGRVPLLQCRTSLQPSLLPLLSRAVTCRVPPFPFQRGVQVVTAELVALLLAGSALSVPLPCRDGLVHEE